MTWNGQCESTPPTGGRRTGCGCAPAAAPAQPAQSPMSARFFRDSGGGGGGPLIVTLTTQTPEGPVGRGASAVRLDAHTGVILYSGANFTGQSLRVTADTIFCDTRFPDGTPMNDRVGSARLFYIP